MAKNEFLPFGTAEGANVLSNQEYEALAARHNGFNSGVAKSKELNKVWRQASLIASAVAQFIVDTDQKDLPDTGDVADIKSRLASAINLTISNGDYVTNPYLKLELLKKIDKADIANQLGNDPAKVASQQLVTTELGKKASVADINGKMAKDQNGADIPNKPKFIENLGLKELFLSLTGGTLTGPLFIRRDGPAFVISPVTENGACYAQGRDHNNKAVWFIGNPTDGGTAIYFRNYITGAEVSLHANGISLNQNTYINGTLELTNYSTFDARYSKIRTVLKSDNGYEKDENTGLIRQWGKTPAFGAGNGSPVKFPIPFPSKCIGVSALPIRDSASSAGSAETIYCGAPGLSGVQLYLGGTINYPVYWEAWGY